MKKIVIAAMIVLVAGTAWAESVVSQYIRSVEGVRAGVTMIAQANRNLCKAMKVEVKRTPNIRRLANPDLWCGMADRLEAEANLVAAEVKRLRNMEGRSSRQMRPF